ncbi:MAG TPA: response regulator [Pirellulales bacterium]|nr:response regulator [Pirellulales bacterium]
MTAARNILIIESDPAIAEGIAMRIRGAGFRTRWTTTALAGRRAIRELRPDLIVLDLELPHRAARKMLIALQHCRHTRGMPVVGSFTDRRPAWCRRTLGIGNCVRKPFEASSLHEAVANSFKRSESRFHASLPRSRAVRIDMPEAKHVLLIDDDRDIVTGACMRLRAAGYSVVSVGDGEQGVAAAASLHPDAIVLDVQMPRMNGMTALSRLKAGVETCHIPVVMLSASLSEQTAALDAGARFYLRKPYQAQTLLAALDAAVGSGDTSSKRPEEIETCPS